MKLTHSRPSDAQKNSDDRLLELLREAPIEDTRLLYNLELFIGRMGIQNILMFNEIYQSILNVHGVMMEFGTRYGHNLALWTALRGIYEPYVRSRKIIGFDSFEGFLDVDVKDGDEAEVGDLATPPGYEQFLEEVLACHEQQSPISHIKKYEVLKGDAPERLKKYLGEHPETIVAFAFFDMDLFEPTRQCLEILKDYITKGTVIGFDQVCYEGFPGETLALKEVFGLDRYRIQRTPLSSSAAFIVLE